MFHLSIQKIIYYQRKNRWDYLSKFLSPEPFSDWELVIEKQGIDHVTFATTVKGWLLQSYRKQNTLRITGPPDTGKSAFAQAISSFFVSDYVQKANPKSDFLLAGAVQSSLVVFEEPIVLMASAQDIKTVLAGQSISVNVKFESGKQKLPSNPVIVTSNHAKFGLGFIAQVDEAALQTRCIDFYFNQSIKDLRLNLSPTSLVNYLFHYAE